RVASDSDWYRVLEYCGSDALKDALGSNEYVVIQIDTDVSEETHYDVPHRRDGEELTPEQLRERVVERLAMAIGEEFFQQYQDRFLMAVCVHSIECWLLPLHYTDTRRSKITTRLDHLNQALKRKG